MSPVVSEPATGRSAARVRSSRSLTIALSFALVAATALLLHVAVGYRPMPSLDDFAYLPVFRHAADPSVYPDDTLLRHMSFHSPGWYWIYRLSDATVGLARGFWIATLALSVATVAAVLRLMQSLGAAPSLLPLVGLLALGSQLNGIGRGAYDGAFGAAFHGQWLALCALLFSYDAFVRRRWVASGVALGVTALSHLSVAIHGGFVLALATVLVHRSRSVRPLATIAATSIVVGLPSVVPLLAHFTKSQATTWPQQRIIQDGYLFRLPHEYTLDLGTTGNLGALLLALAALAGALFLAWSPAKASVSRVLALAVGQMVLLIFAALFYAGAPQASVVPYLLALTRTSPLLIVLLWIVAIAGFDRFVETRGSTVPFHLLAGVALTLAILFQLRMFVEWSAPAATLLALASACWLVEKTGPTGASLGAARTVAATGLAAVAAAASLVVTIQSDVLDEVPDAEAAELYEWSRSTPADAVFIVPPGFETFRWYAERSAWVDFKLFPPATIESISMWRERLDDVARPDRQALSLDGWRAAREYDRCYATRNTPERIAELLAKTNASFFVHDADGLRIPPLLGRSHPPGDRLDEAFRNSRFTVYRLRTAAREASDG